MKIFKPGAVFVMLALGAWCAAVAHATPVDYAVAVDTSSVNGQSGFLDLEFNGSGFPSQSATAIVSNFATDGVLNYSPTPTNGQGEFGDVTGSLGAPPNSLTFDNQSTSTDYDAGFTFGKTITFNLSFSGPALSSPDGSGTGVFQLDFLNADQSAFLLTNDPNGTTQFPGDYRDFNAAVVQVNGDGTTTPTTYANLGGGPPATTITAVPEAAPTALILLGLFPVLLARRRSWTTMEI